MGIPAHFSLEVPKRAHQLLRGLYEHLSDSEGTKLPLKATFLLSVSMPIVILPIERILKYRQRQSGIHLNDAVLNPQLADAVVGSINLDARVHVADFFTGPWQYASLEKGTGFPNLARDGLPDNVVNHLDRHDAIEDARNLSAYCFCNILRNALAHGGVLYLDEHGRTNDSDDSVPVKKFAFVSTDRPTSPTKLHFLRIGMGDYREFLDRWVQWLNDSAINRVLPNDLGLEALEVEEAIIPERAVQAAVE